MNKALEFKHRIIKPVLEKLKLSSAAAEELLLGTAVQESLNFTYRRQVGGGPARGYYQMEPATHDDIWNNYLKYRPDLAAIVDSFVHSNSVDRYEALENNDEYASAMARVHYLRVPAALPAQGDLVGQANYWKQYYNTPLGKGLPQEYIEKWNLYVLGDEH
ncbi:MAG: hypothetical protein MI976_29980 [Pseudomonadales bacterium]|nr:hypothetical protein [Pseudomonadales bacterium]